jgi:hypothetical protein
MEYVNGIALAEGEKVVRKYEASVLKKPKSKGYLIATTRRLIFSGEGSGISGKSILVREVKIDQVSGIESFYGKGWSIAKLIFAIILTLIFLGMYNVTNNPYSDGAGFSVIFLLGLAWPAFLIYKMVTNPGNQMALQVIASNQTPSSIGVAVEQGTGLLGTLFGFLGLGGSHAWMSVTASGPGKHTEVMVRELGALVQDIQAMGDHAIDKWGNVGLKENKFSSAEQTNSIREQVAATVEKISETTNKIQAKNTAPAGNQCGCGATVSGHDVFCGGCGARLKKPEGQRSNSDEEFFS